MFPSASEAIALNPSPLLNSAPPTGTLFFGGPPVAATEITRPSGPILISSNKVITYVEPSGARATPDGQTKSTVRAVTVTGGGPGRPPPTTVLMTPSAATLRTRS